jgi:hypothetical protein
MSSILRTSTDPITADDMAFEMSQKKWKTVHYDISPADLKANFRFFNDAVILRSGAEGVPLMTTTGIYGPILPNTTVKLTPGQGNGVTTVSEDSNEITLLEKLKQLQENATEPADVNSNTIYANWVSGKDGGTFPGLSGSANIFGSTGSLFINQQSVEFPVLDLNDPVLDPNNHAYAETLAWYGAKLLAPGEPFSLGFDEVLWGMEYDTSLPDYIRSYALHPNGGGGMFVEHHEFPHIFLPKPTAGGQVFCEAKVTLGRKCDTKEGDNGNNLQIQKPQFKFTTFSIPSDGSAIVILPGTIHNDSFTNGKLAVFVADVSNDRVDTVALRETAPFKNISLKEMPLTRLKKD